MRYVLLIPGWFPSKVNFLAGDFIERHAKAASLYFPVKILFVVKDNSLSFGKIVLDHQQHSDNYETFIYYYSSLSKITWIEKIFSVWLQAKCLTKGFKKIVAANGLPSLIHAHVLVKHAWFALKKSKQYHIPLVASEQWTGYLPQAKHEFKTLSSFQKNIIRKTLKQAVHVTTVSEYLAQQIKKRFQLESYSVIPNMVDTSIFKSINQQNSMTSFVHISTLTSQKNFNEILLACHQLLLSTNNFRLIVFAPANKFYQQKVKELNLNDVVEFKSEVPQSELSKEVAKANALILYSNYETFGCVIVEANASGVPVIVSDFPVFDENVIDEITGIKVPLHQPKALADCMMKFINKQYSFNKEQIINITKENYSAEVVGKQFANVYSCYAKSE